MSKMEISVEALRRINAAEAAQRSEIIQSLKAVSPLDWQFDYSRENSIVVAEYYWAGFRPHRSQFYFRVWEGGEEWKAVAIYGSETIAQSSANSPVVALTRLMLRLEQVMRDLEAIPKSLTL